MTPPDADTAERRASRLLRWYPRAWRSRCGEEFAELVRRTELSPRVLDFETRLGTAACAAMAVFLGGCCAWILDGGPGPANLFHAGAIDAAGAVVMAIAFAAAWQAARMARLGAARAR